LNGIFTPFVIFGTGNLNFRQWSGEDSGAINSKVLFYGTTLLGKIIGGERGREPW